MARFDCARSFQEIATLRRIIELCRHYGVPYLQLHLTDHEAFRFPSTAFPEVVSKDHYTLEQLRDLDAYAQARGVTLVPELDACGASECGCGRARAARRLRAGGAAARGREQPPRP